MSRKIILPAVLSVFFISFAATRVSAQQRRAFTGKLLNNSPRPRTGTDRSNIFSLRLRSPYRSYNGTNNNLTSIQAAKFGSADIPLFRELPAEYGSEDPKNAMAGKGRPTARKISNSVIDEPVTTFNERGLSTFIYVWGQFIDHDMSLTPTGNTEYVPVTLPPDEKIFTEDIPFLRSEIYPGTGVNNVRQQTNLNTAWIDASMVYGVDSTRARWLRTMRNGKMKTSAGNYLPYNTVNGEKSGAIDPNAPDMANDSLHTVKTFVCGDIRAAEHPGIAALHTLFVREHNRICDRLRLEGFFNDELIYQMARKEVGAEIQAITYQEFLPALGVTLRQYSGYRSNVRPDIMNTFATAAYRVGHTMVADDIMLFDNNCAEVGPGELDLLDAFWTPQILIDYTPDVFLKGLAAHTQYETDTKINSVLRNFLFVSPNDPVRFGIDLGSLNIQRGRDHGLPNYNTARKFYTGSKARTFADITSNTVLADSLKSLYGSVDSVDLWIGALAEDHLPNASVGKTIHEMLRAQFEKLRDGDFYFYKNDPYLPAKNRNIIIKTRLKDVLIRNTALTNLQDNVFFTVECPGETEARVMSKDSAIVTARTIKNETIKVFPNPVRESLNVTLATTDGSSVIRIFSAEGVLMKSQTVSPDQNNIRIDASNLKSGVYIMNITTAKGIRSFKFVKL